MTPIVVGGVTYTHYTDPTFGFSLNIPSSLTKSGSQPNTGDGGGITAWNAADPTAQEIDSLQISTATKGVPASICRAGTPVTVGTHFQGYEVDTYAKLTPNPQSNSGVPDNSSVAVSVVEQGVWVNIKLQGTPPASTFVQRDGTIWHEILASFTPGTYANPSNPCNG